MLVRNTFKAKLIGHVGLGALAATCVWASPATAQSAPVRISIAAQPLATALRDLGRQANAQIIFEEALVQGYNAPAVLTEEGVEVALNRLLEGTGLTFQQGSSGVYIVGTPESLASGAAAAEAVGDAGGVIVVSGRRLNDELAIDVKRNADQGIDVLTADAAGKLPDNNVAESLSRITGVSVSRSGETGTGDYIAVRGLDSALLNVQFDGVTGGAANGGNRSVPLDGISSDDVAEIRVSKSLLPSDDGVGVGGAVNIVSRTPLNGGKDGISFYGSGRYHEFADKTGYDFGGAFTKIFSDNFGVKLSASFRQRYLRNLEIDSSSSHISGLTGVKDAAGNMLTPEEILELGLVDAGTDFDDIQAGVIDPSLIVFEDQSYQLQDQKRKSYSISGAIDWRISDSTLLTLGGRFDRERTQANEYSLTFDEDDGDFVLEDGVLNTFFSDAELDVDAQIEDAKKTNTTAYLKGVTETGRIKLEYVASYSGARRSDPQTDIGFDTDRLIDRAPRGQTPVRFHPYSFTDTYFPVPDLANLDRPGFAQAVSDIPGTQYFDAASVLLVNDRSNDRYSGKLDLTYAADLSFLGGMVEDIRVGAKFERSNNNTETVSLGETTPRFFNIDGTYSEAGTGTASGALLSSFTGLYAGQNNNSLSFVGSPLSPIGISGVPTLNRDAMIAFRDNYINSYTGWYAENFFDGKEDTFAGYAQASFDFGDLDFSGGVRVEHYKGTFTTPLGLGANLRLVDGMIDGEDGEEVVARDIRLSTTETLDAVTAKSSNTEILPRFNARYNVSDDFLIRAGVGYSLARPSYRTLGSATNIGIWLEADPLGGPAILPGALTAADVMAAGGIDVDQLTQATISVSSGNPDLKNARSLNLDLTFEYYPMRGTALTFGLFHKRIKNFIFVGQESSAGTLNSAFIEDLLSADGRSVIDSLGGITGIIDNAENVEVSISQPTNGDLATVSGIEVGFNHQFKYLPGMLSNFGLSANATFTRSRATYVIIPGASEFDPDNGLRADQAQVVLGYSKAGDPLIRRTSFFRAPEITSNATLYYEDDSLEIALSAGYTSESFRASDEYGIDQFSERYFQLDLFAGYDISVGGGKVKLFVEVPDLTDGGRKAVDGQTSGRRRVAFDEASFNGREFRFGFRSKF